MLDRVLGLIAARGWFDTSLPFEKTINLTHGACMWLMLTRNGRCDAFVKFSNYLNLEQEARRWESASRCYARFVPAFVGYISEGGLDILVCRAIDFIGIRHDEFMTSAAHRRQRDDLVSYFVTMRSLRLPAALTPMPNAGLANALLAYYSTHAYGAVAQRWLDGYVAQRAMTLPDMPQHGDFVLNNVGGRRDGSAVIFDWEDFGASSLPGMDLFTLELSLAGTPREFLDARLARGSALQTFTRRASEAMGLSLEYYQALTPLHALVFRYLKRNYGPGVRARIDGLIGELDQRFTVAVAPAGARAAGYPRPAPGTQPADPTAPPAPVPPARTAAPPSPATRA